MNISTSLNALIFKNLKCPQVNYYNTELSI